MVTRRLQAVALAVTLAVIGTADARAATYTVVDADNDPYSGIYLRDGTSMANVRRILERYMLYGTHVELQCGAWGESVGPFSNRRWHQVRVATGASAGQVGWIADRYLDTPNKANEATPGEPECGAQGGTAPPTESAPRTDGGSFFYGAERPDDLWSPATVHRPYEEWRTGNCGVSKAADVPVYWPSTNQNITTLSGWSIGRLGPVYFLHATQSNRARWQDIDYILLFDPGNHSQLTNNKCDKRYPAGKLYTEWLKANKNARLVILAGEIASQNRHKGIQEAYFNYLRKHGGPRDRVVVCNFGAMKHRDVFTRHASYVNKAPITRQTCPGSSYGWNP